MSRPEDTPEDVWEATRLLGGPYGFNREPIARAILAERRRAKAEELEHCISDAREAWLDGVPPAEVWEAVRARGIRRAAAIREDDNG